MHRDPSDLYKEDRFFRDEEERAYQLAKMSAPKNCLHIKDAPRNGKYILLVGDSGYGGIDYRCLVARYVKEYEKAGEDQAENDRRCWRDHSNDHVTDGGCMPEWFMFLPWEYDNDAVEAIIEIVLAAILEDNSNRTHAQDLKAGDELRKALALVFGLTRTIIAKDRLDDPNIKCCPSCCAIAKISVPLATITECPTCGVKSETESWYMPLPNQNQAPQQARNKTPDEKLTLLDELGSYARRYDERVYPLEKGTQTVGIPLELLRKANLLSKNHD